MTQSTATISLSTLSVLELPKFGPCLGVESPRPFGLSISVKSREGVGLVSSDRR